MVQSGQACTISCMRRNGDRAPEKVNWGGGGGDCPLAKKNTRGGHGADGASKAESPTPLGSLLQAHQPLPTRQVAG